jgi:hypothetical protein
LVVGDGLADGDRLTDGVGLADGVGLVGGPVVPGPRPRPGHGSLGPRSRIGAPCHCGSGSAVGEPFSGWPSIDGECECECDSSWPCSVAVPAPVADAVGDPEADRSSPRCGPAGVACAAASVTETARTATVDRLSRVQALDLDVVGRNTVLPLRRVGPAPGRRRNAACASRSGRCEEILSREWTTGVVDPERRTAH